MMDPSVVVPERGMDAPSVDRTQRSTDAAYDDIDLRPYLRRLARRWKLIAAAGALGALASFALVWSAPTRYQATATLVADHFTPLASRPYRALFEESALSAEVISKFQLDKPPYSLTPQELIRTTVTLEEARWVNTVLIRATLRDDAKRTARVANAMAGGLVARVRQLRDQTMAASSEPSRLALEASRKRLEAAEQAVRQAWQQRQLALRTDTPALSRSARDSLRRLPADIAAEEARLQEIEGEIARHSRLSDGSASGKSLNGNSGSARNASPDARRSAANLEVEALQRDAALVRSRLAELRRQRATLNPLGGQLPAGLTVLQASEFELNRLEKEWDLARRTFETNQIQYESSRGEAARRINLLHIVTQATIPLQPLPKHFGRTLVAGFLGGALMASLWVLAVRRERPGLAS